MIKNFLAVCLLFLGLLMPAFSFVKSQDIDLSDLQLDNGPCCYISGPSGGLCNGLPGNIETCRAYAESLNIDPDLSQSVSCDIYPSCPDYVNDSPTYNLNPIKIKFNVPIPGLEQFSQKDGTPVTHETLPIYIGGLYKFLVGIAGLLAVLMIAYGGIVWLFSGGDSGKISRAKEIIVGAIVGLFLALGSYLLLYLVNPKLVNFNNFIVPPITMVEYVTDEIVCPAEEEVEDIPNINKVVIEGASDPRLTPDTINKLKAAAVLVEGTLVIKSAFRDHALQARLYNCYKTAIDARLPDGQCPAGCDSCNLAAEPKCTAPHQTGKAIDVCLRNGPNGFNTCSHPTEKSLLKRSCNDGNCLENSDKDLLNEAQTYLQQIMITAGFSHFCQEWWHFENGAMSSSCAAGEYR